MAYATLTNFKDRYGTATGFSDEMINRMLLTKSEQIDYFTQDRITRHEKGIDGYSDFIKNRVLNATSKAAYHGLIALGLNDASTGNDGSPIGVTSFKLGDLQMAKVVTDQVSLDLMSKDRRIRDLGEAAYKEMQRTGLLFTGLGEVTVIDLAYRVDEGV